MNLFPIPAADPLPLPAPVWLLQTLSVFTFVLHLVPMSLVLGGAFIAAWAMLRRNEPLARVLINTLPAATAMTITLGVAPLLFLQVLYGQFFYTSSILMAVPWMLVVPLLIVAYYGFYFNYFKSTPLSTVNVFVAVGASFAVLAVGFIYTSNSTLMLTPELWPSLITGASTFGTTMNTAELTLIPRYLHMLLGAFAVTGLYLALRRFVRMGALLFGAATLLNIGVGLWFLFSLPDNIRNLFLGGSGVHTAHLWVGVGIGLLAAMIAMAAINAPRPKPMIVAAAVSLLLTIALMATVRHMVRQAYLAPYLDFHTVPVKPMWDVFALFAVVLVAGLAVVGWMITQAVNATAPKRS
jgi:hypothetical protein